MTNPLSPEEKAELLRLCEEATPGPWHVQGQGGLHMDGTRDGYIIETEQAPYRLHSPYFKKADAAFIVGLREATPGLLEENARLDELWAATTVRARKAEAERDAALEELSAFAHEVKSRLEVLDQMRPADWSVLPTQCDAYIWAQRLDKTREQKS